jgi:hypothetical protein
VIELRQHQRCDGCGGPIADVTLVNGAPAKIECVCGYRWVSDD